MSTHHHDHDHQHHDHGLADLLDLDAAVLADALHTVHADIERLTDAPVRTILDLGAGSGTGTFGLLRHFPAAHATAIDASDDMLTHLTHRAEELGLGARITTIRADLDDAVPAVEPADLAWASASLHHLADPDQTLEQVVAAIRPGGLMAVVELAGMPRFLPDDSPGGAAEAHAHALHAADRAIDMPTMGVDWGARLAAAGLVLESHREIVVDLTDPLPAAAGAYASATLERILGSVAERLTPDDRSALEALLDGGPDDVSHRADLMVRTTRWLWIARRLG